jgi:hypothetical protein
MPAKTAVRKLARTVTVLCSTMLIGAALPAVSQAKTGHVGHVRAGSVAGHTSPYTRLFATTGDDF